jgi:4-amino-4-deoxy-L-arabinose transferase-like glycosyltransferase
MTGTKPGGRWMVESVDLSASTTAEGNARRERWAAAAAVTAVALAVRLIHLDTPPFVDELFHVLAAKSYLADGTLEIADGSRPYVRARLYTMLVAGMFAWFGEGLVQARIPAVVAGALLVGVVYMWVHSVAGRWPAVISSLLFCFQPGALSLSQIGRFYTLATLFLWLGFLAVYHVATRRPPIRRAAASLLAGLVCFLLAIHLHPISVVGIGAGAIWLVVYSGRDVLRWMRRDWRHLALSGLGLAAVLAVALALGAGDRVAGYWNLFSHTDYWAASSRDNVRFYANILRREYGPLWVAFPALCTVAVLWKPRPALFVLSIFIIAFTVQSLAAWKTDRYLFYAMPAFFILCGIGLVRFVGWSHMAFREAAGRLTAASRPVVSLAFGLVCVLTIGLVMDAAGASRRAVWMLTREAPDRPNPFPAADWQGAAPMLRRLLRESDVLIASPDLKALYFLERLEYDLFADHLYQDGEFLPEFTPHRSTGIPVVRRAESLARLAGCHASGLVVAEAAHWRVDYAVPAEAVEWIEANLERVALPERHRLVAYRWTGQSRGGVCPEAYRR